MNRKRIFLFVGLSLSVAGLFFGREMAKWRPVEVARFPSQGNGRSGLLSVSNRGVVQMIYPNNRVKTVGAFFDIRSGKLQEMNAAEGQEMGVQDDFFWRESNQMCSLEIEDKANRSTMLTSNWPLPLIDNRNLRILPKKNQVVVLDVPNIYRWNLRDQTLQSEVVADELPKERETGASALSRDARTFVYCDKTWIRINDTQNGKILRTTPVKGIHFYQNVVLSSYGRYVLFDQPNKTMRWEVVETSTGKGLWGFNCLLSPTPLWTISDDEQTIFVRDNNTWEVRDAQTGAVLRRLPCVRGTTHVASSPDGATLYCVANGRLYRQLAR